ncbi:MAG: class I SAM-dependent DNA methyltransferase [Rhodobacteraceae bacterium]|nr:class I SAM-dependent DNA methyltransferase [Paracoccaceae bacterium]
MNAVEIEEAISALAEQPFDAAEFPFQFLEAFGNKPTTIKRLRKGQNKSDLDGVLQTNNIHLKSCAQDTVSETLSALKASPATTKAKAKFILATDGQTLEAEDLKSGETIACDFIDFHDHFGFFLPLAGISTVTQIRESAFDIKATGRLNRLYIELLKDNPDWGTAVRRHDMNHFMARLIFLFFAEDTSILKGEDLFTTTVTTMSAKDSSNTDWVISELFRAMNVDDPDRAGADLPNWADKFPYVNGGLFSGSTDVPQFSKIARSYLLHIGSLDWTKINPDIFGSMIQAVADDEERGALGMHYTSVPNILKVLNPLFLDDLNAQLTAAGDSKKKLKTLRARISKIRVFDPACGSGNFLVIAYKELREIEAKINAYSGEVDRRTDIPLTNYRGIELRDFPAEIARLALIIAEYQCDVTYRGHKDALEAFLPLDSKNWITCANALQLDWTSFMDVEGGGVQLRADDLFRSPLDQAKINFEADDGEIFICGNPPYLGSKWQSAEQKEDLKRIFDGRVKSWKSLDYVAGWFMKAADFGLHTQSSAAFVSTNSICQGQQVSILWPTIFATGHEINFAHTSFKWANLASHNAGVTVAIVAISNHAGPMRNLYSLNAENEAVMKEVENINAYLVASGNVTVNALSAPLDERAKMQFGNHPYYGSALIFSQQEGRDLIVKYPKVKDLIRPLYGSKEFISASPRACLWVKESDLPAASRIAAIQERFNRVEMSRTAASKDNAAQKLAATPYRFREQNMAESRVIVVPRVSSENRPYLPVGILPPESVIQEKAFALYDAPLWNMALIASRLHWVWIGTVCVRMRTDFSYSNTLGWNTFPVPKLTEKNRADLTRCATDILLAREAHFPATIADLYKPDAMPANLRDAHNRNDEVLERIYIGRRFRNDTERLEKLFAMYTKMTTEVPTHA